jgi:hemolysin D
MQREFLISQSKEQDAKLAEIGRQLAQKEAERATISTTIAKLNATIPLLQQRVDVRKVLYDKELGSKLVYLTELGDLVGQQQDLLVQQSRYREADAAVAALAETRAKIQSEYRRSLFDELAKAEQKAAGLAQDVIKAEQRTKLQVLTAPVDGVVQQLAVHTVGGVVTPAQALAIVVPSDSHLEIEAMVSNRDIGFVYAGQEAEIKVDTFSFTRYGLLHGKVVNVSQDAITREKPSDKSDEKALGAVSTSSEPKGQEMNYAARVSIDRTQMQVEDKLSRYGCHCWDQDGLTPSHKLPPVPGAEIQAGDAARKIERATCRLCGRPAAVFADEVVSRTALRIDQIARIKPASFICSLS